MIWTRVTERCKFEDERSNVKVTENKNVEILLYAYVRANGSIYIKPTPITDIPSIQYISSKAEVRNFCDTLFIFFLKISFCE